MKSARFLLGLVCGSACLALLSGCETQRSACEREKRLTSRMDEMQVELDGRITNVNMEFANMRSAPSMVVQQVPPAQPVQTIPDYSMASYSTTSYDTNLITPPPMQYPQIPPPMPMPMPESMPVAESMPSADMSFSNMSVDTISIEDDFYSASKRQQLEALAAESMREQVVYEAPPAPKKAAPKKASAVGTTKAANHIRVPVPVRTIQAALQSAGFYNGSIDGKVGNQTIKGITDFQRSVGLKPDGICGRRTWDELKGYVPAGMSATRLK